MKTSLYLRFASVLTLGLSACKPAANTAAEEEVRRQMEATRAAYEQQAAEMQSRSEALQKQLADRGAAITMDALSYVKRRIERSYAAIESFARAANAMALAENAPVNLTLVKKVLDA